MKYINKIALDTLNLPQSGGARRYSINGDEGATFTIYIVNSSGSYYDFVNKTFSSLSSTTSSDFFLQVTISSSRSYSSSIIFPSVSSDITYDVYIRAEAAYETKLSSVFKNDITYHIPNNDGYVYTAEDQLLNASNIANTKKFTSSIHQFVDTTLTFSLLHSSGTVTEPSNETVKLPQGDVFSRKGRFLPSLLPTITARYNEIDLNWEITTSNLFVVNRQPLITDFESSITIPTSIAAASGATDVYLSSDTTATIRSIKLLRSGQKVSGTNITADTKVKQVEADKNLLSIDTGTADVVSADTTLTFKDTGSIGTNLFHDSKFSVSDFKVVLDDIEILTDDTSSNQTIPLANTNGLKAITTQTVDGAIEVKTTVVLDAITGLWEGQKLVAVSSGSLNGSPSIVSINSSTKEVVLTIAQTFADGITLTFANNLVTGIGVSRSGLVPTYVHSISAGNSVDVYRAGSAVTNSIESGQTIKFTGTSRTATVMGKIKVLKMGDTNFTTTLNLDNILTVG